MQERHHKGRAADTTSEKDSTSLPLKEISYKDMLKLTKSDLPFILLGMLFSSMVGATIPVVSLFLSRIFNVSISI